MKKNLYKVALVIVLCGVPYSAFAVLQAPQSSGVPLQPIPDESVPNISGSVQYSSPAQESMQDSNTNNTTTQGEASVSGDINATPSNMSEQKNSASTRYALIFAGLLLVGAIIFYIKRRTREH